MSLKKQALSGVKWTFLQQLGTQGIGFVISVILARLLMPEEFGLIAMISVVIAVGNTLLSAGLSSSLIRSKELDEEDYSTVFYFNLVASIIIYFITYLIAPFIADFYNQPILTTLVRWLSLIFIINAFATIQQTRLTKQMDFKTQTIVAIPSLIIGGIIGIFMALQGYGVWSLIGYNLSKSLANMLLLWYHSKWKPRWKFNREKFKTHFYFGYKLTLSGLLDTIFNNAYNIVIGKFFPPAQVGYYQRAKTMQMYPVRTASSILAKVTYPLFAQIQDDNRRLKSVYKKILQMNVFILAPVLISAGVLAVPLFRFLFTEKWLPAAPYFQILIPAGILYPIHSFNLNILKVKGRSDLFLKLEIIKKIIIVFTIVMGLQYGIYGLLYMSVLGSFIAFFINTHYSGKFIDYTALEQIKDILPVIFLSLITGIIVLFIDYFLKKYGINDFIRLLIGGSFGIFFYILLSAKIKTDSFMEIKKIVLEN